MLQVENSGSCEFGVTPPAVVLKVRSGIGVNCTNPPVGYLDFALDDGRHAIYSIDDILKWAVGDTSSIQTGDERLVIELLAKAASLSLQLAPQPVKGIAVDPETGNVGIGY